MESLDMREEKKPSTKILLPEGWRDLDIIGCTDEVKSKQGNRQYIINIKDVETGYEENIYAVSEPKKRWFLKLILDACGVEHKEGVYVFEPPLSKHLIGNRIKGLFKHEDNEWINRDGETIKTKQHKIIEVAKSALKVKTPEDIEWKE